MTKKKKRKRKTAPPKLQGRNAECIIVNELQDHTREAIESAGTDLSDAVVVHTGLNRKERRRQDKEKRTRERQRRQIMKNAEIPEVQEGEDRPEYMERAIPLIVEINGVKGLEAATMARKKYSEYVEAKTKTGLKNKGETK